MTQYSVWCQRDGTEWVVRNTEMKIISKHGKDLRGAIAKAKELNKRWKVIYAKKKSGKGWSPSNLGRSGKQG